MKRFILFALLIGSVLSVSAQDARFSQTYASPLNLNPAMTGVFEGEFRVVANYRDQWSSISPTAPFRTIGASFDYRCNVANKDFLSFGVNLMRDDAGASRFTQNKGALSVSFMKMLSEGYGWRAMDQYLVVGAQLGAGQNGIYYNDLLFSTQFDNGTQTVNPLLNSQESLDETSRTYLDFNAGLMWYGVWDDRISIYAGGAIAHLNQPNISFFTETENDRLYRRYTGHLGGEIPIGKKLSWMPGLVFNKQGPSTQTDFGTQFRYSNNDYQEIALRLGVWGRVVNQLEDNLSAESIVVTTMFELDRWMIGLSYDINTSTLSRATNSRGAFEVAIIYIHPSSLRRNVECPTF